VFRHRPPPTSAPPKFHIASGFFAFLPILLQSSRRSRTGSGMDFDALLRLFGGITLVRSPLDGRTGPFPCGSAELRNESKPWLQKVMDGPRMPIRSTARIYGYHHCQNYARARNPSDSAFIAGHDHGRPRRSPEKVRSHFCSACQAFRFWRVRRQERTNSGSSSGTSW
jgi:hypothetical protein